MTPRTDALEESDFLRGKGHEEKNGFVEANWREKIERALAARRAGQELRKDRPPGLSTTMGAKL